MRPREARLLLEYGVIVGLIVVVALVALLVFDAEIAAVLSAIADKIQE